jgi:hypothetical protein
VKADRGKGCRSGAGQRRAGVTPAVRRVKTL